MSCDQISHGQQHPWKHDNINKLHQRICKRVYKAYSQSFFILTIKRPVWDLVNAKTFRELNFSSDPWLDNRKYLNWNYMIISCSSQRVVKNLLKFNFISFCWIFLFAVRDNCDSRKQKLLITSFLYKHHLLTKAED